MTTEHTLTELAKDKVASHLRDVIYEAQYQLKIPFTFLILSKQGLIILFISYLIFDETIKILGFALFGCFMVLKFINLKWYQIYELPPFYYTSNFFKKAVKNYHE